jgi:hypothetical protein
MEHATGDRTKGYRCPLELPQVALTGVNIAVGPAVLVTVAVVG